MGGSHVQEVGHSLINQHKEDDGQKCIIKFALNKDVSRIGKKREKKGVN